MGGDREHSQIKGLKEIIEKEKLGGVGHGKSGSRRECGKPNT